MIVAVLRVRESSVAPPELSRNCGVAFRGLSPAATFRGCSAARQSQSLGCTTRPQCDSNLPLGPDSILRRRQRKQALRQHRSRFLRNVERLTQSL